MNIISDEKVDLLLKLAKMGKSIREMAKLANVSKQTAQNYQQAYRYLQEECYGIIIEKGMGGYWDHKKHYR